ncbi:MauE/DoxX family redox-associated membrane protein [Mesonia sp. K7]|uniref:DoxX family protein n=1 Tax=Mesonia sp. K7 TaxID=2218606 RepID=UPI000DA91DF0|nr:MauE/DoxX family redox-associated membrane protein [Mesonia sp. K7]PZD76890.1 hypothetical protein DNG35_10400 [Mesonia sp. K7]
MSWHFIVMAVLYMLAGIYHFINPKFYTRIMPRFLPYHKTLVLLSGIAEIVLGIGLFFTATQKLALYGIIFMLFIFFIVHVNMLTSKKAGLGIPKWVLTLRLLLQFVLIYWAYSYL